MRFTVKALRFDCFTGEWLFGVRMCVCFGNVPLCRVVRESKYDVHGVPKSGESARREMAFAVCGQTLRVMARFGKSWRLIKVLLVI